MLRATYPTNALPRRRRRQDKGARAAAADIFLGRQQLPPPDTCRHLALRTPPALLYAEGERRERGGEGEVGGGNKAPPGPYDQRGHMHATAEP